MHFEEFTAHPRAEVPKNPSTPQPGSYAWRRDFELLTVTDLIRRYAAIRRPRGPYRAPLPEDFLPGWRPGGGT